MAKEIAEGANIRRQKPQSCQRVADNAFHVHCQSNLQKGAVYGRACDSPEGGKRHAKRNFLVLRVVSWRHPVFLDELYALKPVSFHYKKEIDQQGIAQFGWWPRTWKR
jgi:hypothetical protein